MLSIIFFNTHPIQYFVPLYQAMAKDDAIDLTVLYCSDETLKGTTDKQFGVKVQWDIPLLQGYQHQFLKNNSFKPSIFNGFWGLMNWGVIGYLRKAPKSMVVVHGWASFSHVITLIAARLCGHTVCLRAETPLNQELLKNKLVRAIKNSWLRFLFLFVHRFLYIGQQNKLFYASFGIKEDQLFFTPYAVDNERFQGVSKEIDRLSARKKLGLPLDKKIVLFSGKYIHKKRPLDLLEAFNELENDSFLVMVGEGELRVPMETYITAQKLSKRVFLTGFINQSQIPLYYAAADAFVMCSGIGETWGLSVNEAMNFSLPIVITDICGCSFDLVKQGSNGFLVKTSDITGLKEALKQVTKLSQTERQVMGMASLAIIGTYSYQTIIAALKKIAAPIRII